MMRPTIYLIISIKKLCKKIIDKINNKKNILMEVPTMCDSRKEKDFIICSTIDFLEQNIKIKNYE